MNILNFLKSKIRSKIKSASKKVDPTQPQTYVCEEISLKQISHHAIKVIQQLKKAKYEAYLVGGSVRDLLLSKKPKDFDIATNANPEQIKVLFKRAQLIGRRFKIVHVCFPNEIIEVSTFRSMNEGNDSERLYTEHGFLIRDNLYGTIGEDAYRRDFTVNALYYDITTSQVIDYVKGFSDIKARSIKIIGEPEKRLKEDPLRMLRAIRLSARLQFPIHPDTEKPFKQMGYLLRHIPGARLLDELLKIYRSGHSLDALRLLKKHHLMHEIFPFISHLPSESQREMTDRIIEVTLANADKRMEEEKSLSSGLLFAAFLWYPLQNRLKEGQKQSSDNAYILNFAIHETLAQSMGAFALTRKIKLMIREIWLLQFFFTKRKKRQIYYAFQHRYFRNAYHLLNFRVTAGEEHLKPLLDWWTQFISGNKEQQAKLIEKKPDVS